MNLDEIIIKCYLIFPKNKNESITKFLKFFFIVASTFKKAITVINKVGFQYFWNNIYNKKYYYLSHFVE